MLPLASTAVSARARASLETNWRAAVSADDNERKTKERRRAGGQFVRRRNAMTQNQCLSPALLGSMRTCARWHNSFAAFP